MRMTFSIPLDAPALPSFPSPRTRAPDEAAMDVDAPSAAAEEEERARARRMTPTCIAPGCANASKYRLRANFTQGVCGIEHLKLCERAGGRG